MIATQYQSNIQVIRTDNGSEFVNQDLKQYLNLHGIVHQITCPYTPQQNGVAERKNRHLLRLFVLPCLELTCPPIIGVKPSLLQLISSTVYPLVPCNFRLPLMCFITLHFDVYLLVMPCIKKDIDVITPFLESFMLPLMWSFMKMIYFISGDNLETSGECPSDGNREEYPGENEIGVPHDVPTNQMSSPTDFMPESHSPVDSLHESHVNSEFEHRLKVLPNRVTRGKPKVSYEPILNSKSKYPINNYEALKDSRWREAMNEEMKAL
ncbi:hypothetical protein CK203_037712 [Vitis vinifera]|uniref:Integrase catalytic domain-containing protein n=1 Tax=Vitis vinifera TaxID=29760 RepID=A0A438IHJ5_VITVI|nr:hypothetical protein CK203_037712 [Vitis vinifera]